MTDNYIPTAQIFFSYLEISHNYNDGQGCNIIKGFGDVRKKLKYILTAGEHKQNFDIKVSY